MLKECNCNPQFDPWQQNTGGETYSKFYIDLESGNYGISQECHDNTTPEDEWNGRVWIYLPEFRPDEDDARDYLLSEDVMKKIKEFCDSSEILWIGNNFVGKGDSNLFDEICAGFNNLAENQYYCSTIEDYFNGAEEVTAYTTDEELEDLIESAEIFAKDDRVILDEGIREYLARCRQEKIDELEDQ